MAGSDNGRRPVGMSRLLAFVLLLSMGSSPANAQLQPSPQRPRRVDAKHLPNPVQVHAKVISGGLPEGDAAFQELQSLGVKTIISVDGMKPDVETASKYGLRYIHLPHGYDGIPAERVKQLATAVRQLDGPIYIHCHHGKHRSPAAASVACVAAGLIPQSMGVAVLELAGTSPNYRGLYESARQVEPLDATLLDELKIEFPAFAEVPPMAEAMVALGHTHDHLKSIAEAGWKSPADHPDLSPAHEALLMREHFTELLRSDGVQQESAEFRHYLEDSEHAAQELEDTLRTTTSTSNDQKTRERLQLLSARITANCKSCHEQHRDVPLSQK